MPQSNLLKQYKTAEISYYSRQGERGKRWIKEKPFGEISEETLRLFRDFSTILQLLDLPPRLPSGAKILDLGTGSGWVALFLAHYGFEVTGIDVSPDMINIALQKKAEVNLTNIKFFVGDVENKNLIKEKFDAIVCYSSLHHINKVEVVLSNCYYWLKPKGKFVLGEPNFLHQFMFSSKTAREKFGVREQGFTPWYLKRELQKAGFLEVKRFYPSNPAMNGGPKNVLKHILQPLIQRLTLIKTPLWFLAMN